MTNQKAIFISGGAAGIGAETARLFAQNDWYVGIYDCDVAAAKKLASTIGKKARSGLLDVTKIADWNHALDDFYAWSGQLDVLLNNAGVLYSGAFENTEPADHQRTIEVNVVGVMHGCHAAFPYLLKTPHSRVINMSSASAIYGQPSLASYSSSKFAVRGLTEALDLEWRKHKIRVMDIMPLFVHTKMVDNMDAQSIRKLGVKLMPSDVAEVVFKAAHARRSLAETHWPVGIGTKIIHRATGILPERLARFLHGRVSV